MALFDLLKSYIPNRLFLSYQTLDFMLGSKTPRFRSIKSALPIQLNPHAFAFMGFRWILARSRGYIFRVRVPYFEFMALSLFFQKW